jgi:hypothetical protein
MDVSLGPFFAIHVPRKRIIHVNLEFFCDDLLGTHLKKQIMKEAIEEAWLGQKELKFAIMDGR